MKRLNRLFISGLLVLTSSVLSAQELELGMNLGVSNYQGDLVGSAIEWTEFNLTYGILAQVHLGEKWSVRGQAQFGNLTGDIRNKSEVLGNYQFKTRFTELAVVGHYNILGNYGYYNAFRKTNWFSLFAYMGVGITFFDGSYFGIDPGEPEPDFADQGLVVPFGGGIRVQLSDRTALEGDMGLRASYSDGIDGVVSNANDWYMTTGIQVVVYIGE